MASGHRESNLLGCFWQMKNNTLAGYFGFVGDKMAFTIGKLTKSRKPFYYLQKQCKYFLCLRLVDKNNTTGLAMKIFFITRNILRTIESGL